MSSEHIAQAVLDDFGAEIGLGAIPLDATGQVALTVGPLEITIAYESTPLDMLWLYADLGSVAEDDEAPAFLLNLCFLSWLGDTMTIAVEENSDRAIGYTAIPMAMLSKDMLRTSFEKLARAAIEVRARLAERNYTGLDSLLPTDSDTPDGSSLRV